MKHTLFWALFASFFLGLTQPPSAFSSIRSVKELGLKAKDVCKKIGQCSRAKTTPEFAKQVQKALTDVELWISARDQIAARIHHTKKLGTVMEQQEQLKKALSSIRTKFRKHQALIRVEGGVITSFW